MAVLLAVLGLAVPVEAHDLPPFEDTADTYYSDAASALGDEHIVTGCSEGEYCPAQAVSRGQMATILFAAMQSDADGIDAGDRQDPHAADAQPAFDDVVGTTHEEAIAALAEAGVTAGCTEEAFCPQEPVTRAQMATLLVEVFDPPQAEGEFFDDTSGHHANAIDRLAVAGIAAGCGEPLTAFCPDQEVRRSHVALFVARAMDFVERTELAPLAERRAEQAEIDAQREAEAEARRQAEAEAEARRQAEEDAQREAAAKAAEEQNWRDLAQCESGMNQRAYNSAGPYYGYFQFNLATWQSVGMTGDPRDYSWDQQLTAAKRLHAQRGWYPWPACAKKLGLI